MFFRFCFSKPKRFIFHFHQLKCCIEVNDGASAAVQDDGWIPGAVLFYYSKYPATLFLYQKTTPSDNIYCTADSCKEATGTLQSANFDTYRAVNFFWLHHMLCHYYSGARAFLSHILIEMMYVVHALRICKSRWILSFSSLSWLFLLWCWVWLCKPVPAWLNSFLCA